MPIGSSLRRRTKFGPQSATRRTSRTACWLLGGVRHIGRLFSSGCKVRRRIRCRRYEGCRHGTPPRRLRAAESPVLELTLQSGRCGEIRPKVTLLRKYPASSLLDQHTDSRPSTHAQIRRASNSGCVAVPGRARIRLAFPRPLSNPGTSNAVSGRCLIRSAKPSSRRPGSARCCPRTGYPRPPAGCAPG